MADISLGNIVANLKIDSSGLQQGLQQAQQAFAQLQQSARTVTQSQGQLLQGFQQVTQATAGQAQAAQTVSQAQRQTAQTAQQATQALQGLQQGMAATAQATQAATAAAGSWRAAFQIAAGIGLATTIQGIAGAFKNVATESIRAAISAEQLTRAFRAIEGSSAAAQRTMTSLFASAQRVGADFTTLATSFKSFEASAMGTSLAGDGIRRVFDQIVSGSRVLGLSSQQLGLSITALSQILSKGRLSAEELNQQLAEHVPMARAGIAQSLGVTTQALTRLTEDGLVPASTGVIAFGEAMDRLGQSEAVKTVDSLAKAFANLKNESLAWFTFVGEWIGSKLQPFLKILTQISAELRALFNIPTPGGAPATPSTTGQSQMPIAPSEFTALIQQEARRSAIDPGLLSQLIRVESNFNPNAVSKAGAIGLGQIMLPTGQSLEMGVTEQTLREPERNVRLAAKYLADMIDLFRGFDDQVKLALAAYNVGPGAIQDAVNAIKRAGESVTFEGVLGRLSEPRRASAGPYVERVLGATMAPEVTAATQAAQTAQAAQAAVSSVSRERILQSVVEDVELTLKQLPQIRAEFEKLQAQGLNVGGVLDKALRQQAERAQEAFGRVGQQLARIPGLIEALTPTQLAQIRQAGQEVLLLQERLQDVAPTGEDARRRIQQMREVEQLMERMDEEIAREARQERRGRLADLDIFGLTLSPEQEEELKQLATAQRDRIREFAKNLDIFGLDVSPEVEQRRGATAAFAQRVEAQIDQQLASREQRPEMRLRAEAERQGAEITPEIDAQLKRLTELREEQERLNHIIGIWGDLSQGVGSAWTNALLSIADGTRTVAEAFREMARSIMQSMIQIASQEAFKAIFRIGVGLITAAFMPSTGAIGGGTCFAGAG